MFKQLLKNYIRPVNEKKVNHYIYEFEEPLNVQDMEIDESHKYESLILEYKISDNEINESVIELISEYSAYLTSSSKIYEHSTLNPLNGQSTEHAMAEREPIDKNNIKTEFISVIYMWLVSLNSLLKIQMLQNIRRLV